MSKSISVPHAGGSADIQNVEQKMEAQFQQRLQAAQEQVVNENQRSLDLSVQLANQEVQSAALATERDGLNKEIQMALQRQEQFRRQSTPLTPMFAEEALRTSHARAFALASSTNVTASAVAAASSQPDAGSTYSFCPVPVPKAFNGKEGNT